MTLDSSRETVAILYDIENAPFEMLSYTLGKAKRYQPCRTIVVSDWDARPEQKRWDKLLRRPGFTFRQINRTYLGKNSLDSALYDSAKLLYEEGVRRYFVITTDSDFVRIAEMLNAQEKSYIIGVGTKQASETLRSAYDEFFVYPPEEKPKKTKKATKKNDKEENTTKVKGTKGQSKTNKTAKATTTATKAKMTKKSQTAGSTSQTAKAAKAVKTTKTKKNKAVATTATGKGSTTAIAASGSEENVLSVKLPKTLRLSLQARAQEEGVSLDEVVTFLLMRGLTR